MKNISVALLCILILSCTSDTTVFLSGTAPGTADGTKVYLQRLTANNQLQALDTAVVASSKFTFQRPPSGDKELNILTVENEPGRMILIEEDAKLTATLYKDSLATSTISGGPENDLFQTYIATSKTYNKKKGALSNEMRQAQINGNAEVSNLAQEIIALDKKTKEDREQIINENPNSIVSVIILSDLVNSKAIDITKTDELFTSLSEDIKKTSIATSMKTFIAQQKSSNIASRLASVGNQAPAFSSSTPEGKELALADALGKYTIIDFWASWCRPCRVENPNVVKVYEKYHDKGLNIISVSLDRNGQAERWKKAIKDDNMDWYHVSNLQFWQDPIARAYGVRSIPATFLLDENGIIIDKNLRGQALERKMDELLGS